MSVPKTLALSVCHTASFITLKLTPVDPGMVSSPAAEACKQLLEEPWQARDDLEQPSWSCDWGEAKLDQGCKGVGSLCFFHTQRKMVQMIYRFKCIDCCSCRAGDTWELWHLLGAETGGHRGLGS